MHLAMWSGPRNLSTALMYSFSMRDDFDVVDEPFYAAYLRETGLNHPMRDEIISSNSLDPREISNKFSISAGNLYSKQMTHHMLPQFSKDWFSKARHAFLIRHPVRVVRSYSKQAKILSSADLGFEQQQEIYHHVVNGGDEVVVIDSFDIRKNPEDMLRRLCDRLGLSWDHSMLSWPEGGIKRDGIWAKHWYASIHSSTGFQRPEAGLPILNKEEERIAEAAMPFYDFMTEIKI